MIWPVVTEGKRGARVLGAVMIQPDDDLPQIVKNIKMLSGYAPTSILQARDIRLVDVFQLSQTKIRTLRSAEDVLDFNQSEYGAICSSSRSDEVLTRLFESSAECGPGIEHLAYYGTLLDVVRADEQPQYPTKETSEICSAPIKALLITSRIDTIKMTLFITVTVILASLLIGGLTVVATHTWSGGMTAAGFFIAYSAFVANVFQVMRR